MVTYGNVLQIKRNFVEAASKWREAIRTMPAVMVGASPCLDIGTLVGGYASTFTSMHGATGIPVWLLRLVDECYACCKLQTHEPLVARDFVVNFFEAIPVGANLGDLGSELELSKLTSAVRDAKSAAQFVQQKRAMMFDPLINGLSWADDSTNELIGSMSAASDAKMIESKKVDPALFGKLVEKFNKDGNDAKNNSIAVYSINTDVHMAVSGAAELMQAMVSSSHFCEDVLGFMKKCSEVHASATSARDTMAKLPSIDQQRRNNMRESTRIAFYTMLARDIVAAVRHYTPSGNPVDLKADRDSTLSRWSR